MTAPRYLIAYRTSALPNIWAVARRFGIEPCFETKDVHAYATPGYSLSSGDGQGLVIGTIFERNGPPRNLCEMDDRLRQQITQSAGRSLITTHWGAYCTVFHRQENIFIMRDPSGGLPAYYVTNEGGYLIGSDAEILAATGVWSPTIHWDEIARHLYSRGLPSPATSLAGLRELLPGTMLAVEEGKARYDTIWSPWSHVESERWKAGQDPVTHLRRTAQNVVAGWSARYPKVMIGVSGGLDSSIVAASVPKSGRQVTGVTLITEDPDGDERRYTRILGDSLGIEIVEEHYDLADIDLSKSCVSHLPRPIGRSHALAYDRVMQRLAHTKAIDAFLSGNGGDNVFYYTQSASPIADRLLAEGPRLNVWGSFRDVCGLTGCTARAAASATLHTIMTRKAGYRWKPDASFLNSSITADLKARLVTHPWLEGGRMQLPGKAAHVAALLRIHSGLEGYDRSLPPMINPLMSQPMLELCLSIPSWFWVAGGRDRSVARAAFCEHLPAEILERRSKGGPDGFANQLIAAHRKEILSRLVDGHLARHGIIDVGCVQTALSDERPNLGTDQARILSLLDTEAWIDHWSPIS